MKIAKKLLSFLKDTTIYNIEKFLSEKCLYFLLNLSFRPFFFPEKPPKYAFIPLKYLK
jgi:hypothetical protein